MKGATVTQPACPRCAVELTPEIVGVLSFRRCGACGGVWLDPDTLRTLCEADAKPRYGRAPEGAASDDPGPARREDGVRYLRCPVCGDLMSRVNFARVSGVILDVCRSHGAWFDAGELRAVRRFVRGPGLSKFERRRALDLERERLRSARVGAGSGGRVGASVTDLIDALAGIPDRWDVPSTKTPARGFLRAGVLGVIGGAILWGAFRGSGTRVATGGVFFGGIALLAALRALGHALARRGAQRETTVPNRLQRHH
jgi:Zn-finger nucleic acid-binding protein